MQACHAVIELTKQLPATKEHPNVILLVVKDEDSLYSARRHLRDHQLPSVAFHEPDIGNKLTAIASGPVCGHERRHFRGYQLLRE